ncbi:MAG: hypothetical protein JWR61_4535 [Ferruginibacter sp.]|uniref:hypothetical protein n=1 Tax=Ferruginibacter sp. TaxID=1940288 RepID=UPI0026586301|nr:hypothetical protein [Ferruginibacter sp.]MDB5279580.1 hypothetical protein [Ferruginibacter sp.]
MIAVSSSNIPAMSGKNDPHYLPDGCLGKDPFAKFRFVEKPEGCVTRKRVTEYSRFATNANALSMVDNMFQFFSLSCLSKGNQQKHPYPFEQ